MSVLTYAGISFGFVKTNQFTQRPKFSDDGTEYLYTVYTISITAVYNPQSTSYSELGFNPGQMPAQTDREIRGILAQPRKQLYYSDGVNTIISSPADGNTVDAVNGPTPHGVSVREIAGTKTWLVEFTIETSINECPRTDGTPFVANRWNRSHSVDEFAMTTCLTQGVAIFRMDALELEASKNADHFRDRIIPGPPPGFRRVGINVASNPIGNILQYAVTDREEFYPLGDKTTSKHPDVVSFDAVYAQSTVPAPNTSLPGATVIGTINISVQGRKTSNRANLIIFATKIALEKLGIVAGAKADMAAGDGILTRMQVTENLSSRSISFMAEAMFAAGVKGKQGTAGLRTDFFYNDGNLSVFDPAGRIPQMPNAANTRGTYTGEIMVAAIKVACARPQQTTKNDISPGRPSSNSMYEPVPVEASVIDSVDDINNKIAPDNGAAGTSFTDYKIGSNFSKSYSRLMAPVSGSPAVSSSSSSADPVLSQAEFMTVASPVSTRSITWTAERVGRMPAIPTPNVSDENYVLLDSQIKPTSTVFASDLQTPVYRISGTYVFGCRNPVGAGDDIPICVVPWMNSNFGEQMVSSVDYVHGLIDDSDSPGEQAALGGSNPPMS